MSAERILAIAGVVILLIMALTLTACGNDTTRHVVDTVEVSVPVLERAEAPKELYRANNPAPWTSTWVSPQHPGATVCLMSDGESQLKTILRRDESLLEGWERLGSYGLK